MLSILFEILTSDDMQDFIEVLWLKLGQKIDFLAHFERVFVYAPWHPMSYAQDFAKWKTVLRNIFVVSFISIAYVVVKLKIFKVFCIDSASMKWPLFGFFWVLTSSNIVRSCWNFDQSLSPIRKTVLQKSFKILHFGSNGTRPRFMVLVHFGAQFTAGQPKILIKAKISAKTTSLGISNSVSPRSQKNHSILVKLSKKHFWTQNGSKLPHWGCNKEWSEILT